MFTLFRNIQTGGRMLLASLLGLLCLATVVPAAHGQSDPPEKSQQSQESVQTRVLDPVMESASWQSRRTSRFSLSIGAHSWPALSDLNPALGGGFDAVGLDLDIGWHVKAWKDWFWGADVGLFFTESNVPGLIGDMSAEGMYITPSVKIPLGKGNTFLDAGVGYYILDLVELNCDFNPCIEIDSRWEKNSVGGYLGLTRDFPIGVRGYFWNLSFRIHYANFGTPQGLGPSPGSLNGPIFSLMVGWGG